MSDLKPINREEAILSGEDIKPLSRKEYFLKKLGKGGSGEGGGSGTDSSLPPYTSNDIGKVLTVSTEDPVMQETVIVPEQTVTFEEGGAELNNVIEYTGEEPPVLGGDYAGWVYRPEALESETVGYVYSDPVLGDSKAIGLSFFDDELVAMLTIGSIENGIFSPDSSVSDISVTISATATMPVVPTVPSMIAPTQTVTFEEEQAQLSNVAISPEDVKFGTSVTATIIENGTMHVFTLNAMHEGPAYVFQSENESCMFGFNEKANLWAMIFGFGDTPFSGEATVSVEGQVPKPKVKWENKSGGTLYLTFDDIDTLNASYNDIMDAVDNGCSVCIKTLVNGGMECAYLISVTSYNGGPKPYVVKFASVEITGSVPSLTVDSYSASSPTENLAFGTR